MGPAGAGKTTIGDRLASALDWAFYDADALHSPESVERMREGTPLDESDRAPWLEAIAALIRSSVELQQPAVIACSALRESHRRVLREAAGDAKLVFVYLRAAPRLLVQRLAERRGHFFPPALLESQLATLEEPPDADNAARAVTIDAGQSVESIVEEIRSKLRV